jgi:hypothetical protein
MRDTRLLKLTDPEIVLLDGKVRDEVQPEVDAAKARLDAIEDHPDLPDHLARFVADAVTEARANGRLVWHHDRIRSCPLCGRYGGYAKFKSGPRRGQSNTNRPLSFNGVELARRFVTMEGHVTLGGCVECVETAEPTLRDALRGVEAQVPDRLRADGEPKRVRYALRRCTECGWEGHEGEMGRRRTIMGDGTYPAACPSCKALNELGRAPVERRDGFVVAEFVGGG